MACIMLNPLQSIVLTQLLMDVLTLSESVLWGLEVSRSELGTLLWHVLPACALGERRSPSQLQPSLGVVCGLYRRVSSSTSRS